MSGPVRVGWEEPRSGQSAEWWRLASWAHALGLLGSRFLSPIHLLGPAHSRAGYTLGIGSFCRALTSMCGSSQGAALGVVP